MRGVWLAGERESGGCSRDDNGTGSADETEAG